MTSKPVLNDQALARLAWRCRERARAGWFDGTLAGQRYVRRCTHLLEIDPERCAQVIYTRDRGHHTSGWWKNPDYELCQHLSLSFQYIDGTPATRDRHLTRRICEALFADHLRLIWCEPPYSDHGKQLDVWHYRLFTDAQGAPILPRGEVYSTKFTELGWKSWSEVQAEQVMEVAHG